MAVSSRRRAECSGSLSCIDASSEPVGARRPDGAEGDVRKINPTDLVALSEEPGFTAVRRFAASVSASLRGAAL